MLLLWLSDLFNSLPEPYGKVGRIIIQLYPSFRASRVTESITSAWGLSPPDGEPWPGLDNLSYAFEVSDIMNLIFTFLFLHYTTTLIEGFK